VKGWTEKSTRRAIELVKELNGVGLAAIIYTDISRDGEMLGPNLKSTGEVIETSQHAVIASGGVSRTEDVKKLARLGAAGTIIGRALYEGTLTLEEAIEAGKVRR
jgi:phosphoribosylformimino-5-aminoimidazole carboxamide ribotide isomerase